MQISFTKNSSNTKNKLSGKILQSLFCILITLYELLDSEKKFQFQD